LKQELKPYPLNPAELVQFIRSAFDEKASSRILKPSLKEDFLSQHFTPRESHLLRPLWGFVFEGLEEELGRLDLGKDADFRYISAVLVKNSKAPIAVSTPSGSTKKVKSQMEGKNKR